MSNLISSNLFLKSSQFKIFSWPSTCTLFLLSEGEYNSIHAELTVWLGKTMKEVFTKRPPVQFQGQAVILGDLWRPQKELPIIFMNS